MRSGSYYGTRPHCLLLHNHGTVSLPGAKYPGSTSWNNLMNDVDASNLLTGVVLAPSAQARALFACWRSPIWCIRSPGSPQNRSLPQCWSCTIDPSRSNGRTYGRSAMSSFIVDRSSPLLVLSDDLPFSLPDSRLDPMFWSRRPGVASRGSSGLLAVRPDRAIPGSRNVCGWGVFGS